MTLMMLLWQFILIGLLTFGGGLVAVTLLFEVFVETGLITETWFYHMLTISESTPGPIAINLATYLGFDQFGVLGGVLATLGFVLPSIGLLWVIYPLYQRYRDSEYVIEGMAWLRAAVLGLILVTLVRMAIKVYLIATPVWIPSLGLILLGTILLPILKNRPYAILAIGAVFGMIFF